MMSPYEFLDQTLALRRVLFNRAKVIEDMVVCV